MSYKDWQRTYSELGMWARPIKPKTKACPTKNWQLPDNQQSELTLQRWLHDFGHYGIGLVMGSPIEDGTFLGALDVDRDEYVPLARTLLRDPPSGRIGQKGAVFFVRVRGDIGNPEFRVDEPLRATWGKVAECLFRKKLCVIPPTVHPNTNAPYHWIGKPLHEIDLLQLPLIGE